MSVEPDAMVDRRQDSASLRLVFAVCGIILGWLTTDLLYAAFVHPDRLRLLTSYLLPVFGLALVIALWRFGRAASARVPVLLLVAGGLFHAGAAACDLFVTARSDPYLTLEANPYIRALLDGTQHPYLFIYAHTIVTHSLFVGAFVMSWWAFLRHRRRIAESISMASPQTWPQFVKAATGGGRLTYRQWLFPLRPSEIPNSYHSVWPVALAVSFGTSLLRYWAVCEWLWLVPAGTMFRLGVLLIGVGGTLLLYFGWLAREWRRSLALA